MPTRMPTYYIPHGAGPCFFINNERSTMWEPMAQFLRAIAQDVPYEPTAVLVISAHWLSQPCRVTHAEGHPLLFDYYGFPEHTYQLQYPAPGCPHIARRVIDLLAQAGISCAPEDERGWDHGVFVPLLLTYPHAKIPVVQLSLEKNLDPSWHLQLGQALTNLRDEGVLILGSGMSFHNMRAYGNPAYTSVAESFDQWLSDTVQAEPSVRNAALANWQTAPGALASHPLGQEEHLLPLMVVAGAASTGVGRKVFSEQVLEVPISGFRFD